MTKKERVLRAIEGLPLDETPSSFSLHFPVERNSGQAAVEEHLNFFRDTDMDILKIMNENLVPDFGSIRCAADWKQIPTLSMQDAFMREQMEITHRILEATGPDVYYLGTLHGVCASGIHPIMERCGYDVSRQIQVDHLRENKVPVLDALRRMADVMCELAESYVKAGVQGVYYAALGGEHRYFTDEEFAEWIEPLDRQIMNAIREAGGQVFLHICKDKLNMERYRNYGELADVVNWGVYEAPFSLEEGKAMFPECAIMGGFPNRPGTVLVDGPEDAVRAHAMQVIETFGRHKFILGADCTLPTDISCSHIRAAAQAARGE